MSFGLYDIENYMQGHGGRDAVIEWFESDQINSILAGLSVPADKPVTPRSRGVTYCMGCAAADDGQFPWQVSLQVRAQGFLISMS